MKTIITFFCLFSLIIVEAQTKLSGKVVDEQGIPLGNANVYIDGTYDGTSTDTDGEFTFMTTAKGEQILIISFLTFETLKLKVVVESFQSKTFKLKSSINALDAVMINAGTFESGDNAKVAALKPLDIVTTAGSAGNIIAALQTLPGTQTVGESGKLFVRGGEADETQTFIDGIRVAQPYGASTNNLPTRGRFSPFLFDGISFSTGGYSAEYGEALSSVLLLSTIDEPVQEKTDIAFMTVGLGLGNTQKWDKSSLSVNMAYTDLTPYQKLIPQNISWNKPYQSLSGEAVYRRQFENGLLKLYTAFNHATFDLDQNDVNHDDPIRVDMNNNNFYLNGSYKGYFGENWQIVTGLSYGYDQNKIGLGLNNVKNGEHASHLKLKLRKNISDRMKLTFGGDYFITKFDEDYREPNINTVSSGYQSNIAAVYSEMDIFLSKKLAGKIGVRASQNGLLDQFSVSPRASIAYKMNKNAQVSFAYGDFVQAPRQDYLKYATNLENEKTQHYILNYQYNVRGRIFRAEAYYKKYDNLVKYDTPSSQYNSVFNNSGNGYAQGLDLFWRDSKTIKNLEYWISYSYINTERDFKNYPTKVTPNFVADHTFSIVTKYWIDDLRSQVGVTHTFTSGRPYNNPNEATFMNGKTKAYNNLSLSWAYLLSPQKILYFSISNVLGFRNIYGYDYSTRPDLNGVFKSQAVTPTADRFFFVGFFWTISDDKKSNQLENLN